MKRNSKDGGLVNPRSTALTRREFVQGAVVRKNLVIPSFSTPEVVPRPC